MIRKFYLFIFLATLMFLMSSSQEACARELQLTNVLVNSSLGDVNDDGTVSVTDVMVVVHIILGEENEIDDITKEKADINGDGIISVSDVMALVHIILNGEDSINNVVVNGADGITYEGGGNGPARVGQNHLWPE